MKELNWQKVSDKDWDYDRDSNTAYVVTNNNPNINVLCHRVYLDRDFDKFLFTEGSGNYGFSQFIENCDLWVLAEDFDNFIKETLPKK